MQRVEAVVLGVGGVGSAALYALAERGVSAIGIDRFPPGHDRGSSHGDTRLIRLAYFEGSDYVPLLRRSYELWEALAEARGETLYREVGLLQAGSADGPILSGVRASAARFGLEIDDVDPADLAPRFRLPDGFEAVFERRAGLLHVEDCVRAHVAEAEARGAQVRVGETVLGWEPDGEGVAIRLQGGERILADRVIVTAGAWAGDLLASLQLPLTVTRQVLFWFEADPVYDLEQGAPCFLIDLGSAGIFYGFPSQGPRGLKVAEHFGGRAIDDPLAVAREVDPAEQAKVEGFLRACLPGVSATRTHHAVCMYTLTPDEDFVVDRHPEHPQVVFTAGLSGHGFKMAPALGEVMAELATTGATRHDVGFLRAARWQA